MKKHLKFLVPALFCLAFTTIAYYPIDGYTRTGIKRLLRVELIKNGVIKEPNTLPPGAMKSYMDISLNLTAKKNDSTNSFFKVNDNFQSEINGLFRGLDKSYSIAVLDISDPENLRFAKRNETAGYQPGSVGKIAVLVALFTQLANIYPDSFEKRLELLRTKSVKAGQWGMTDSHTIPIFNIETNKLLKRQVIPSDVFSLFEWYANLSFPIGQL